MENYAFIHTDERASRPECTRTSRRHFGEVFTRYATANHLRTVHTHLWV